jgi:hypothetical protein
MKKLNKNWLIVIILIAFTVTLTGYFLFKQRKYSISEITADNYRDLLKVSILSPIYKVRIDQIIENSGGMAGRMFFIYFNENLIPIHNDNFVSYHKNDWGDTVINIVDAVRDLDYGIYRINGRPTKVWMGKAFRNPTNMNGDEIKRILSEVISQCGFVIKKSELISGNDILIREEEDCFRIVELAGKYENCVFFTLLTYSRN